tara:strand:- start:837 stop:1652 length:816 start_codon:yes stop_codon:yes gene_type:complete
MLFTVLGSSGFIGKNLISHLKDKGMEVHTPDIRREDITKRNLGHVIYAIGDFDYKKNILNFIESHVGHLNQLVNNSNFESLLYCSSTRVYSGLKTTREDTSLNLDPTNINNLYPISKVMGESICLAFDNPKIRIARLSNVSGFNHTSNLFLPSIIRDAVDKKNINLSIKLESEKDYVHIDDVVKVLPKIALNGKYRIYNVAKGENTTNQDIITKLQQITSCKLDILEGAKNYSFPKINTERIVNEFNFNSKSVLNYIDDIVGSYKNFKNKN